MKRFVLCLLLLLALCAGPALCMGGLFEHACDCGAGNVACQHEDSCSDDPCVSVLPRTGQGERAELALPWIPAPASLRCSVPDRACSSSARAPRPPRRAHVPYARSDRPLLL